MARKRLAGPAGQRDRKARRLVPTGPGQNKGKSNSYAARRTLDLVLSDPSAPATARVSAARALAEMDGQLGKHQAAPERTADRALSRLSRDELERELGRLRALIDLGAFP